MKKIKIEKIDRKKMSKKFIEYINFSKIAAFLSDYGYTSNWNYVDDKGADFICNNIETSDILKIQLKARITVDPKYCNKDIYMAFPKSEKEPEKNWVIVSHDKLYKIYNNRITPKDKGRSSVSVPQKDWEDVEKLSILDPFNL